MSIRTEAKGNAVVVRLTDQLTMGREGEFKEVLVDLAASNRVKIVLDMTGVAFMDSAGLGMLIWALKNMRQRKGDVRVFGLGQMVKDLFQITNMDQAFRVFGSEDEATASFD